MNTTYQTPDQKACAPVTQITAEMITSSQDLNRQVILSRKYVLS